MKKQLLIFIFLLISLCGYAQKTFLDKFYTDVNNQEVQFFASLTPGDYNYRMDLRGQDKIGQVVFSIESADPSLNFIAIRKLTNIFGGEQDISIGFSVSEEAMYKFSIMLVTISELNSFPYIEALDGGNVEPITPSAPRSLMLEYQSKKKNKNREYEWLYGELLVPKGYLTYKTSYIGLGYLEGYLGASNHSEDEFYVGLTINSSKDDEDTTDATLIAKGDKVKIIEEQQAGLRYKIKPGIPVQFIMNIRSLPDNKAIYSAWFKDQQMSDWRYIASWKSTKNATFSQGVFSAIDMSNNENGNLRGKVEFFNVWGKEKGKKWTELDRASVITNSVADRRIDIAAGRSEYDPHRFFLATGGHFKPSFTASQFTIEKAGKAPEVNTVLLVDFIDEVLEKGYVESWGYQQAVKIPVISGEASNSQLGEGIENSYDGNYASIYHSSWSNTVFPVTLTYHLSGTDSVDYLVYHPRSDGGQNGNIKQFALWVLAEGDDEYTQMGEYDFVGTPHPSSVFFPKRLIHPKSIKLVVNSGVGDHPDEGFVSCGEMEFYKKTTNNIPDVFTDTACSGLKADVKPADIERISISEYRDLAKALYNNTYPKAYRIREYFPYPQPWKVAEENKTSPYSLLDNATGIFVEEDEDIIVFVGDTKGQSISLRSVNHDKDYASTNYLLVEGINKIQAKDKGLLYVIYHTDNKNAPPIKLHIATGKINGYYDVSKNSNEDWKNLLDSAVCDYMDVLGKYAHLTFAVEDFKKYTPDIDQLISVYDSIVWLESEFIGLNKYQRANKNRMYFYLSPMGYYMFATPFRTGYSKSTMSQLCNPELLRTDAIWGPAHEVGHMNQTTGFKWVGLTEVSNNVYSMYVQRAFGNSSRLYTEKLNSDFDGVWSNRYEKGFTEMIAGKTPHMKHGDVFCKLIPFWQLELYNALVKGQKDFYADVHEQIRKRPIPERDDEAQLQFIKICCEVAETDLTDFFEKWGFLSVIDGSVADHSSIQNVVNYTKDFNITQKDIDEIKAYASKYEKPDANIHYIHDNCLDAFINAAKIESGEVVKTDNHIQMKDWHHVIAYEIYDGERLFFVTPCSEFDIPKGLKNITIHAIPAKGIPVIRSL